MPKIFLSYRRADSADIAGRIYDRLEAHFGAQQIFIDIDTIPFGVDFRQHIEASIQTCDVFLAIIGDRWLARSESPEATPRTRLDDPEDFVRLELEAALRFNVRVIPVLTGTAVMPKTSELPDVLANFAFLNCAEVRSGPNFKGQIERLIKSLESHLAARPGALPASHPLMVNGRYGSAPSAVTPPRSVEATEALPLSLLGTPLLGGRTVTEISNEKRVLDGRPLRITERAALVISYLLATEASAERPAPLGDLATFIDKTQNSHLRASLRYLLGSALGEDEEKSLWIEATRVNSDLRLFLEQVGSGEPLALRQALTLVRGRFCDIDFSKEPFQDASAWLAQERRAWQGRYWRAALELVQHGFRTDEAELVADTEKLLQIAWLDPEADGANVREATQLALRAYLHTHPGTNFAAAELHFRGRGLPLAAGAHDLYTCLAEVKRETTAPTRPADPQREELRRLLQAEVDEYHARFGQVVPFPTPKVLCPSEVVIPRRDQRGTRKRSEEEITLEGGDLFALFQASRGRLLLLGEEGTGKTKTLNELAQDLLLRAGQDPEAPLPFFLHCGDWERRPLPLQTWIGNELALYQVSEDLTRAWLKDGRLCLLFDGLDETQEAFRAKAVNDLNRFMGSPEAGKTLQVVVASRVAEYRALGGLKLQLESALRLERLSTEPGTAGDALALLTAAGEPLKGLRDALERSEALQELARTPLLLHLMMKSFRDKSEEAILAAFEAENEQASLFHEYVEAQFAEKGNREPYAKEVVKGWLGWLARAPEHKFQLENIQPNLLQHKRDRLTYLFFSRTLGGLALGLSLLPMAGGFAENTLFGGFTGLIVALLELPKFLRGISRRNTSALQQMLRTGLLFIICSFLMAFLLGYFEARQRQVDALVVEAGSLLGVLLSFFAAATLGPRSLRVSLSRDIRAMEVLSAAWPRTLRGALYGGAGVGLVIGVIAHLLYLYQSQSPLGRYLAVASQGLGFGAYGGLAIGLAVGALAGLAVGALLGAYQDSRYEEELDQNGRLGSNLGLRRVFASCARMTGLYSAAFALVLGGFTFVLTQQWESVYRMVLFGLTLGLLAGLRYGGFDLIQHYTLRAQLHISGQFPFRPAAFLSYASQLTFLPQRAGGYVFFHKSLRDTYFTHVSQSPATKRQARAMRRSALFVWACFLLPLLALATAIRVTTAYAPKPHLVVVQGITRLPEAFPRSTVVELRVTGQQKVGDYVGFIGPEGTQTTLLGIPVGDTWDAVKALPHGALLCRVRLAAGAATPWQACISHPPRFGFLPWNALRARHGSFVVPENGYLELQVNDTEQENNYGGFYVTAKVTRSHLKNSR